MVTHIVCCQSLKAINYGFQPFKTAIMVDRSGDSFLVLPWPLRVCLAKGWTRPNPKFQKFLSKSITIFVLFISHQSLLITIYKKKITTKQNFSLFNTKHSYFCSHIYQICYSAGPFPQVHSFAKHSQCTIFVCLHQLLSRFWQILQYYMWKATP